MEIPVYSVAGQQVDRVPVDEAALGGAPNMALLRQAVLMYEANRRVGTAKTKTRCEVHPVRPRGGGTVHQRPWRQKHTGRARHGSRRSPIWVGGGVAHGARPREYRKKMPAAARRAALRSAFLAKAADGEVLAVADLELPEPKTRQMAAILGNLGVQRSFLIVLPAHDAGLWRCTRNIPGAAMCTYRELNAYEMIRPSRVIFALEALRRFLEGARGEPAQTAVEVSDDG
jgi:large subunit ribosomal protein L4